MNARIELQMAEIEARARTDGTPLHGETLDWLRARLEAHAANLVAEVLPDETHCHDLVLAKAREVGIDV